VSPLPTETLDFADGHTVDADVVQGLFDVIQFKGFYDCLDLLHLMISCCVDGFCFFDSREFRIGLHI
jgi:hypothetical protein